MVVIFDMVMLSSIFSEMDSVLISVFLVMLVSNPLQEKEREEYISTLQSSDEKEAKKYMKFV
jgi:hypothetical protein